jgi:hypothetical protein
MIIIFFYVIFCIVCKITTEYMGIVEVYWPLMVVLRMIIINSNQ